MMLRRAVETNPGCDGILLGSHGLFTWGDTQQQCYANSIQTIDQMGEFIQEHEKGSRFGGAAVTGAADRDDAAAAILPYLRGVVSSNRRMIAHHENSEDALSFANSKWAEELCGMGTSCPDHFLRTALARCSFPGIRRRALKIAFRNVSGNIAKRTRTITSLARFRSPPNFERRRDRW